MLKQLIEGIDKSKALAGASGSKKIIALGNDIADRIVKDLNDEKKTINGSIKYLEDDIKKLREMAGNDFGKYEEYLIKESLIIIQAKRDRVVAIDKQLQDIKDLERNADTFKPEF